MFALTLYRACDCICAYDAFWFAMVCNDLNQSRGRDSCDVTVCSVPLNPADKSVVLYGFETYVGMVSRRPWEYFKCSYT